MEQGEVAQIARGMVIGVSVGAALCGALGNIALGIAISVVEHQPTLIAHVAQIAGLTRHVSSV